MLINNIHINIKLGDITDEKVDAIVNAANNSLHGGGGVDGAIHRKGGRIILELCKKHGGCPTGEARITAAGDLPAKYVIHTVGPVYGNNKAVDEMLLYSAYYNSLKLAEEYGLRTISIPCISTGAYGYPVKEAVLIVHKAIKDFSEISSFVEEINLVLYSPENLTIYNEFFNNIYL